MARKPRDYDAELRALTERTRKLKSQRTVQLGEIAQMVGADALPIEAFAGVLIAAVEQSRKQPEAIARWAERGEAFFQQGSSRRSRSSKPELAAAGVSGHAGTA